MNAKSLISSWFGLGMSIYVLQYPFQYLFQLLGMESMQSLAVAIAACTAAMLFTYYAYPRIMSPWFKIYAIITAVCASVFTAALFIISNPMLREWLGHLMQSIFQTDNMRTSLLTITFIVGGLLLQWAAWYLFITLGNKQMIKSLEQKK